MSVFSFLSSLFLLSLIFGNLRVRNTVNGVYFVPQIDFIKRIGVEKLWAHGYICSIEKTIFFFSFMVSLMCSDFVNVPPNLSLDALHKMVVENGGTFSMNLNNSVSHCIAAEGKGLSLSLSNSLSVEIVFNFMDLIKK